MLNCVKLQGGNVGQVPKIAPLDMECPYSTFIIQVTLTIALICGDWGLVYVYM